VHFSTGFLLICPVALALSASPAPAETKSADAPAESTAGGQTKEGAKKEEAKPLAGTIPDATRKPVVTANTVTIAGQRVTYTAETGMLPLLNPNGTARASVFYVAYVRQGESNLAGRPITFCFNGGPGAASVWLHLGALGPRRAKLGAQDATQPAPFGLVDNEFSILHVTDLVFIDPVATGFSRPAEQYKAEQFFGKSPDIESVGEFIRLWITRHQRWLSPKYICGESYGVFRAAGLARHLHSRYGMSLSGLMLVSGLLDFATLDGDLSCQTFLPAYTATAQFHKRLPPDLQADLPKALAEAREFMRTDYAVALFEGDSLSPEQRARVVAKLSRLTGLSARVIEDNNLRIESAVFRKELLRDEGLVLGRFDARITGRDANAAAPYPEFDPSLSATYAAFSAAMNAYVRGELKFEDDLPYGILNSVSPWPYGRPNAFPSVTREFASEMKENPQLRVLVLAGRCDLACPVDSVRYSIDHLRLDSAHRRNIAYAEYDSGHMMYVNPPDLRKMQKDLEKFLQK
jgi:carboxypeptidase C (cathepsin A)